MHWWHWVMDGLNVVLMGILAYQAGLWKIRARRAQWQAHEMIMVAGHLCGFDRTRFLAACERREAELVPKPASQN